MKQPVYLGIRSRQVLRRAAVILRDEAAVIHHSHNVDGVILDRKQKRAHDEYLAIAADLNRIARERVNKEPAK